MRRTGRTRIAALVLIALLIGAPGLLRAGCFSCKASSYPGMACHPEKGPELHPACCGGTAAFVRDCCTDSKGALSAGNEAALAPQSPASVAVFPDSIPVLFLLPESPDPVRLVADPPWHERVGLYTLYSAFLI